MASGRSPIRPRSPVSPAISLPDHLGKIERFHQALNRWLAAHTPAATLEELTTRLKTFSRVYNNERPHRAIGRRTPEQAYTGLIIAEHTIDSNRDYQPKKT